MHAIGLHKSLVVCDVEYVERWLTQMCGVLPNACDVAQAAPEVVIMHVGGKLCVEVLCCPGSCLQLLSSTMRRNACDLSVCLRVRVVVSVPLVPEGEEVDVIRV